VITRWIIFIETGNSLGGGRRNSIEEVLTFVVSQSESNFPDRKGNGEESREEMITVSQKNHTERSTCRRRRHLYLYIASGFTFYIITKNSNRKRKSLSLSLKRRKKRENSSPVFFCVKWRVYQLYIKCFKCAKEKKKKKTRISELRWLRESRE
jgi:hypothetical protein